MDDASVNKPGSAEVITVTAAPKRVESKLSSSKSKHKGSGTKVSSPAHSTPKASRRSSIPVLNESAIKKLDLSVSLTEELPVIPSKKSEKFKPILYTFRIPNNAVASDGHTSVKCPPFYIQLDHTLAVIWSLFCKHKFQKPLGVVQIQWALSFLKGIRNRKGKHPTDIAVCIEAMEEALIQQYAAMANSAPPAKQSCCFRGRKKSKSSSETSIKKKSSTTSIMLAEMTSKSNTKQNVEFVTQKLPFSITYAEMAKLRPNHVEQLFKAKDGVSMTGADIQQQLDNLKNVVNSEGNLSGSYSRENMVEFLKIWRKEQINKLQEELQRLHSIETFIGNLDKDNFKPYLENHQVNVLVAQKVANEESGRRSCTSIKSKKSSKDRSKNRTK